MGQTRGNGEKVEGSIPSSEHCPAVPLSAVRCLAVRCPLFAVRRPPSAVPGWLFSVRCPLFAVRRPLCTASPCSVPRPPASAAVRRPLTAVRGPAVRCPRFAVRRSDLGWVCFEETRGQSGGVGTSASLRPKSALLFRTP